MHDDDDFEVVTFTDRKGRLRHTTQPNQELEAQVEDLMVRAAEVGMWPGRPESRTLSLTIDGERRQVDLEEAEALIRAAEDRSRLRKLTR